MILLLLFLLVVLVYNGIVCHHGVRVAFRVIVVVVIIVVVVGIVRARGSREDGSS